MLIRKDLREIRRLNQLAVEKTSVFRAILFVLYGVDVRNVTVEQDSGSTIEDAVLEYVFEDPDLEDKIISAILREYEKKEKENENNT